jgi:hypothetical protein
MTQELAVRGNGAALKFEPGDMKELLQFAEIAARSDLVPKDYRGNPGNIVIAVMMGNEIGLKPTQALQGIAVINGRPSVWGDAALALCLPHLEDQPDEYTDGEGDAKTAHCILARKGRKPVHSTFSIADAKAAGLYQKRGSNGQSTPWITHEPRMMKMRARGFGLRDTCADILRGIAIAEEAMDIPPEPITVTVQPGDRLEQARALLKAPPVEEPAQVKTLEEQAADAGLDLKRGADVAQPATHDELLPKDDEKPIQSPLRKKMFVFFRHAKMTEREPILDYCETLFQREIVTTNDLNDTEVQLVIDSLEAEFGTPPRKEKAE